MEYLEVILDGYHFEVGYTEELDGVDITYLHSTDAVTGEDVDLHNWLQVQFSGFTDKLEAALLETIESNRDE